LGVLRRETHPDGPAETRRGVEGRAHRTRSCHALAWRAGEASPGTPAPFVAVVDLLFDSVEAFQAAFGAAEAEIVADIPNYTSIEPVVQISETII